MSWSLSSWLSENQEKVERRWSQAIGELPAYPAAAESVAYWRPLIDALSDDGPQALPEQIRHWALGEVNQRGATPAELLAIAEGLSATIWDALPKKADTRKVGQRLSGLVAALAHHFADEASQLTLEKSQLETLYEITQELSASLDLRRALQKALDGVTTAVCAEMGAVLLEDGTSAQLVPGANISWSGAGIPLSVIPSAWQMGQPAPPIVVDDLKTDQTEDWIRTLAGPSVASLAVAPMIANGEFRGLMAVASSQPRAFDANQARLFHSALGQIATAIGNAEVYRIISEQAQELGQMLRRQQEEGTKSQAILASIADGVVVNDTDGRIILVNPAAERILGRTEEQMVTQDFRSFFSIFGDEGGEEVSLAMEELLNAPVPEVTKTFRMQLALEQRVIHALLSPVLGQRSEFLGVVTIFRDITKEVEADRAKSEFVSTVSHELRTPMTSIKGYTDLLHGGAAGSITDEQGHFLGIIKSNTERLTALINDLLDISRVETGRLRFEPKPLQFGEVAADVVNALAGQAEDKGQILTYEVVAGLPNIMGDRDRLNQVLTNLVGNAIHYTPEGGEIEVHVYPVKGAVRIDVRDTGIGIAPEDIGHIFERFYRSDHPLVQETRGTGLGLSIVKLFVEMHGGRIWVESEVGQGSTFTFVLPVPGQEMEEEKEIWAPPRLIARMRKILVVDDDRNVANLVRKQLEDGGYRVATMGRGRSIVPWAEENKPDLILLDLILPDASGADILRELRLNPMTADIPVIAHTIVPDDGSLHELGIASYLIKPVPTEIMLNHVEKALSWQGRILIVEDDPDTIGMLSATIRQVGFTPLTATDGYEALAMARRYRPDLILLDLRLPGMDGFEALTHLKRDAVTQAIPIVTISAHVSHIEQERKRLIALGAHSFLPKPFAIGDLLSEIESALQGTPGPEAITPPEE